MARHTIRSRQHGQLCEYSFFAPDGGGDVRLESGANTGTRGQQICYGGGFTGNTVTATPDTLADEVRKWWRARRRKTAY